MSALSGSPATAMCALAAPCWQPVGLTLCSPPQGMLEPTKEPVKPVSAAEMIASIAQMPPAAPEQSPCPSDTVQVGQPAGGDQGKGE